LRRAKLALLAIVAVLSLFLAACGDDEGESIPADHAGQTQCLVCHAEGVGGAPRVPAVPDHSTLADERAACVGCHAEE
jgi:hypothetical protein